MRKFTEIGSFVVVVAFFLLRPYEFVVVFFVLSFFVVFVVVLLSFFLFLQIAFSGGLLLKSWAHKCVAELG